MGKFVIYELFLCLCAFELGFGAESSRFHVIKQWKYLNFTWPDEDTLRNALAKGLYVPENNLIAGLKYYDGFYYVTLPRMKMGVPATLARIPVMSQDASPPLQPFPSWQMNDFNDCNSLQSVQNIEIDRRGQMWILDVGRVETLASRGAKCPPKLIIFDIKSNRTTTVFNFPENVASKNSSYLYDLVVDDADNGQFAYITDNSATNPGIIVFSVRDLKCWKVRHMKTMFADAMATQFQVNDVTINAPINIAGIALGPKVHASHDKLTIDGDRDVFYSPLSSLHLYSISSSILRNAANSNSNLNIEEAIKDYGGKSSQSVGMVMDNEGVLYYGLLGVDAIARWDSHTPFQSSQKVIAKDSTYIEWPNAFAFDSAGNLTVVVNRLNKFIFGRFNLDEDNFRLISANVGGRSYLFDDQFYYDHNAAKPEPDSTPEPNYSSSTYRTSSYAHVPQVTSNVNRDDVIIQQTNPDLRSAGSGLVQSIVLFISIFVRFI